MTNRRLLAVLALIAAMVMVLSACSNDEGTESPAADSPADMGTEDGSADAGDMGGGIATTLADFSITPAETEATAGEVTFDITNEGQSEHELVVLKTDLAPDALPPGDGGVVSEDGLEVVDEAEDIAPGTSTSLSVNLEAGSYVLICNLPGHYGQGMHAGFTVN